MRKLLVLVLVLVMVALALAEFLALTLVALTLGGAPKSIAPPAPAFASCEAGLRN